MYTDINFKTKKALKEAFKNGDTITTYQPGGMFPSQTNGNIVIEGPQNSPKGHSWYAQATIKDGIIISMK